MIKKSWIVHKFGGTSVANATQYRRVAEILKNEPGTNKAIVVSAMSKITDGLIELTTLAKSQDESWFENLELIRKKHILTIEDLLPKEERTELINNLEIDFRNISEILRAIWLTKNAHEKTIEFISGHGEIWSAQILNAYLKYLNFPSGSSTWLDARKVLHVDHQDNSVFVDWAKSQNSFDHWLSENNFQWIVITGFIATGADGTPTTLKRNGSDYSASIFGALLHAESITIWTDVDGVLSADPRLVPDAVVLEDLSFEEITELAYFGAKVVHPSTMTPAIKSSIPIWVRNTFNPRATGTKIHKTSSSKRSVKGFTTIENIAVINVEGTGMIGVPGVAQRLFGALREVKVSVIMISQASSEQSICLAVPAIQGVLAKESIERIFSAEIREGLISQIHLDKKCSILAAVGDNMAFHPGIAGKLLSALGQAGVNVRAIAQGSSERNISVVISKDDAIRGLRAVHSSFILSNHILSIGVLGVGGIGSTFLSQVRESLFRLKQDFKIDLRVKAIANSRKMLLSESGINLDQWKDELEVNGLPFNLEKFRAHIKPDYLPHSVMIDCTSNDQISNSYLNFFENQIHIITPNKKANTSSYEYYLELKESSSYHQRHFLYETTVGAGLPVINTLRDLVNTGDKVFSIEGVLSGTLSFIFNTFSEQKSFSQVVYEAKSLGFTEPDPRDDLSGLDVARKLVILAREAGFKIDLSDVKMHPILPADFLKGDIESFLNRLPNIDSQMLSILTSAKNSNQVIRFVGEINQNGEATVGLKRYPIDHPFARLQSTDNIVSFHTSRYFKQPLLVQGPGAGRDVTAGGVFADVLRLCCYLGAQL